MGTKRRRVEVVVVAPPWREVGGSFSAKVIIETRPENVKQGSFCVYVKPTEPV